MSLASKWRPKNFEDVYSQEALKKVLHNFLTRDSFPPLLFFGGPGLGKTTLARIFAKHLCGTEKFSHNDFIEIDGASHNGVDEIRSLIEEAEYGPIKAKKKVYLIDEVHMLSQSAFNALLKIFEEPPKNVHFLLATTEKDKIPETILSRVVLLPLQDASVYDLEKYLQKIFSEEKLNWGNNIIRVIAQLANGSYRNCLTILEPFLMNKTIEEKDILEYFGLIEDSLIDDLLNEIFIGNFFKVKNILKRIFLKPIKKDAFIDSILKRMFLFTENFSKDIDWIWIYEVFYKDSSWIKKSFFFQEPLIILFKKITLRHFYQGKYDYWKIFLNNNKDLFSKEYIPFFQENTLTFYPNSQEEYTELLTQKKTMEETLQKEIVLESFFEEKNYFQDSVLSELESIFGVKADAFIKKNDTKVIKRSI